MYRFFTKRFSPLNPENFRASFEISRGNFPRLIRKFGLSVEYYDFIREKTQKSLETVKKEAHFFFHPYKYWICFEKAYLEDLA